MDHGKTYFIFPSYNYQPDDYIQLGQVITDPRRPFERLAKPLPLDGDLKPRVSTEISWNNTSVKTSEKSASIFAQFLSAVTAKASGANAQSEIYIGSGALLETHFFEINDDRTTPTYVERTTRGADVQAWLKKHRRMGKTVYMIVGLKIARLSGSVGYGAADSSRLAAGFGAAADGSTAGGTVKAGGEAAVQTSATSSYKSHPVTPFVYAYRLRKLRVTWRNMLKSRDDLEGGSLFGVGYDRGADDESDDEEGEEDRGSALEMESVLAEQGDFGKQLPAKDKKFQAVDDGDESPCWVVHVAAESLG